jgi:hypothetical protein
MACKPLTDVKGPRLEKFFIGNFLPIAGDPDSYFANQTGLKHKWISKITTIN